MSPDVETRFADKVREIVATAGSEAPWEAIEDALWREADTMDARIGPERAVAARLRAAAVALAGS